VSYFACRSPRGGLSVLSCIVVACFALSGCGSKELEADEDEPTAQSTYALESTDYARTRYPIILVGGAFAFDQAMFVDYWYGISDRLRSNGAAVYVTALSSAQSNELRNEELLADVQRVLAITGAAKVNIIAHSQGVISARYVAGIMPEAVASVTSAHGMNQGTHVSEKLTSAFPEHGVPFFLANLASSVLFTGLELFATFQKDGDYDSPSHVLTPQTLTKLAQAADRKNYPAFNAYFPAGMPRRDCMQVSDGVRGDQGFQGAEVENGIHFYSWTGTDAFTSLIDPLDQGLFRFFWFFMPGDYVWDGLVPQCGANLGKVIRNDYPLNHGDAINQLLGTTPLDVPSIYVKHANFLKNQGL
jgi:triacylglycerol lipase